MWTNKQAGAAVVSDEVERLARELVLPHATHDPGLLTAMYALKRDASGWSFSADMAYED